MFRVLICKLFGHRWEGRLGLVEGVYEACTRCYQRGAKVADWIKK